MTRIGIDLGATKMQLGLVSNNKILRMIKKPTKPDRNQDEILNDLIEQIDHLFSKNIESIGIGVPTIVSKSGIMYQTHNISALKEVKIKEILENRFKVPVFVDNDSNCFALGEKNFGKGKKYKNFVGVTLGSGLGTGIIINNKLYRGGEFGGAGEFGRSPFLDGTLEDYCSGKFFINKYHTPGSVLFKKKSLKIFKEFGVNLGHGLAIITNALAPEAIIIGGSISKSHQLWEDSMRTTLKEWTFNKIFENLKIIFSDNTNISILGASSLNHT